MKILLFGSTGMLGTAIESVCRQAKNIDLAELGHEDFEITDEGAVRAAFDKEAPDVAINAVAMIGANACEKDPTMTFAINAIGSSYIAKVCGEKNAIFIQPSSHAVFNGNKDGYYIEEDIPRPLTIYSGSKFMAEVFAMNLCKKHYITRFPTMFGPRSNKKRGFVDKAIEKIKKGESLKIADDKIDSMTYSMDAARRVVWIIERKMPYGVYHIANAGIVSYYEFVKKLIELMGLEVKIERAKDRDFNLVGHRSLKTAMASSKLPPMRGWEEALSEYVSTYLT